MISRISLENIVPHLYNFFRCMLHYGLIKPEPSWFGFFEELDLFKVPLNSIFNTCQVNSAADTDKYFMSIVKAKFNNVFQEGLGCCTKVKATLKLKSDSKPIFRPKRPVPYAAFATVENELNRLQQAGVIQTINYSSWAAPIVMVKKTNGKIKWCTGYTSVSTTCTGRFVHKTQRWNLFCKAGPCRCLSTNGSWWRLKKINIHKGLFQFFRLPFGVKSAPVIFQQTMDTMLTGLPGVSAYIDDIIITSTTPEELLHHLTSVLDQIQQYGFCLRLDKCKFFSKIPWIYIR